VSIHIFRLLMDRWHLRPAARLSAEVMATSILDAFCATLVPSAARYAARSASISACAIESSAFAFRSATSGNFETGLAAGFLSPAEDLAVVGLLECPANSITAIWCPSRAWGNRTQRMCLYGPRSNEQKHMAR
jgi:hypothetical protein